MGGFTTISSNVCIDADIEIVPEAKVGEVEYHFVGKPNIEKCKDDESSCSYMVNQTVCVSYPLSFSTKANT